MGECAENRQIGNFKGMVDHAQCVLLGTGAHTGPALPISSPPCQPFPSTPGTQQHQLLQKRPAQALHCSFVDYGSHNALQFLLLPPSAQSAVLPLAGVGTECCHCSWGLALPLSSLKFSYFNLCLLLKGKMVFFVV